MMLLLLNTFKSLPIHTQILNRQIFTYTYTHTLNRQIFHLINKGHTGTQRRCTVPEQQMKYRAFKPPLTEILSTPHVHHHIVLPQLFKVVLIHYKEATSNHRSPGQQCKIWKIRYIRSNQILNLENAFFIKYIVSNYLTSWRCGLFQCVMHTKLTRYNWPVAPL